MGDNLVGVPLDLVIRNVPDADSAANITITDVIGNKDDTTAGDSVVALLKQIAGATGVNLDEEIDAITAAIGDMTEDTLTSLAEKLGDDSVSLKARLDTLDALFPVPTADAATNTSVRDVVGNKSDTVAGDSLVALSKNVIANQATASAAITSLDGKIDTIDGLVDDLAAIAVSADSSGTLSYLDAGGEQTVVELTTSTRKTLHGIWLDMVNLTQDGTVKVYHKIDGTNYRLFKTVAFTVLTDPDGLYIALDCGITSDLKVTYTEGADETAARDIPYSVVYDVREAAGA